MSGCPLRLLLSATISLRGLLPSRDMAGEVLPHQHQHRAVHTAHDVVHTPARVTGYLSHETERAMGGFRVPL